MKKNKLTLMISLVLLSTAFPVHAEDSATITGSAPPATITSAPPSNTAVPQKQETVTVTKQEVHPKKDASVMDSIKNGWNSMIDTIAGATR